MVDCSDIEGLIEHPSRISHRHDMTTLFRIRTCGASHFTRRTDLRTKHFGTDPAKFQVTFGGARGSFVGPGSQYLTINYLHEHSSYRRQVAQSCSFDGKVDNRVIF
jgi:hypothetical protein